MNNLRKQLFSLAIITLVGGMTACTAEDQDTIEWDEEEFTEVDIGQTQSELTISSQWSWGTPGNNGADLDLGPDNTQTCFLTGVEGSLRGGHLSSDNTKAMVSVFRVNGRWKLRTRAGLGTGAMGHVKCISATANRVFMTWTGNWQQPATVPLGSPKRHCFLTGVTASTGFTGKYNGIDTYVRVRKTATDWRLQGYLEPKQNGAWGGTASAVCVDIPAAWSGLGTWIGPNPGSSSVNMGYNSGGMGCFLQGIQGNYYLSPPPYGWDDGVLIYPAPAAEPGKSWWKVRARSGKGAHVECIQ